MKKPILFLSIFLSSVFKADARQDTIPSLQEVIVKTSRMNTNGKLIPFSYSILDSSQMARQNGRSVPELLDGTAGVFIQKTSHGGGSPFVRGLTGNQNLILIDGIRLNNAIFRYGPNQYATLIDPLTVERIEVIKGTGSVQYGSDAMGGVINIITRSPEFSSAPRWSGNVNVRSTSSGMESSLRPQLNYSSSRFAFQVSAGYSDFGDLRGGDTTGFQRPSGYLQQTLETKAKWDAGKGWLVTAGLQGVKQQMVPLFHKYRLENFRQNFSDPLERGLLHTQLQKNFRGKKIQQFTFLFAHQKLNEQRITQAGNSSTISFENDRLNSYSLQSEAVWKLSTNWSTRIGIEGNHDKVFSTRNQLNTATGTSVARRGLYPNGATFSHGAIYNLHQFQKGKWQAEGGLRYHWYQIHLNETTLGKISVNPNALVYLLGGSYSVSMNWVLFGNLSSGYRAPNIDDMGTLGIIDFRYEVPSYGLQPEKTLNKEMGVRFQSGGWRWSGSFFHSNLFKLINRVKTNEVISGYNVYIKENNERAFIRGFEMESRYQLNAHFSIHGMMTYLFGQNITRNEPVRRIPPYNGMLNCNYRVSDFNIGLNWETAAAQSRLAQGDKDDNRIPSGGTPGFNVFHLYAGGKWKQIQYQFFLNNLTNSDYRKHGSGINGMGRSVTIALRYGF
jgi:outer membrane cobalamin receptor